MKQRSILAAFALSMFVAGAVQAQAVMKDGVLTDAAGRTLYTFDKDEKGKSNCLGGCLFVWPAFNAKPEAVAKGEFGLIDTNGARQWTLGGKPLYYFSGDAKPGDRNGHKQGGVWHVIPAQPVAKLDRQPDPKAAVSLTY